MTYVFSLKNNYLIFILENKMAEAMDAIKNQLAILEQKALRYEYKMKQNRECALMCYYKRMAREKGVTLEEWLENRPKMGRPKKVVNECVEESVVA
jgi:hypothetical protein